MARSLTPFGWGSMAPRGAFGADSFTALHREMDRLFDSFLRDYNVPEVGRPDHPVVVTPRLDVSETDKEIRIEVELPGITQDDVEVELVDDVLSIRGEKKMEQEEQRKGYHVKERTYGSFARSMRLPFDADPDQVKASFSNGVLTISIPKPQESQGHAHKIEIKGAAQQTGQRTGTGESSKDAARGGISGPH